MRDVWQYFSKFSNSRSQDSLLQLTVIFFFSIWTLLLGVDTWKIQHSCAPMFRSSGDVSSQLACSNIAQQDLNNDGGEKDAQQESSGNIPVSKNDSGEKPPPSDSNIIPDLVGLAAASVATGGLAVVGAPVAVVAGVGVAVWFVIRSLLSSI